MSHWNEYTVKLTCVLWVYLQLCNMERKILSFIFTLTHGTDCIRFNMIFANNCKWDKRNNHTDIAYDNVKDKKWDANWNFMCFNHTINAFWHNEHTKHVKINY